MNGNAVESGVVVAEFSDEEIEKIHGRLDELELSNATFGHERQEFVAISKLMKHFKTYEQLGEAIEAAELGSIGYFSPRDDMPIVCMRVLEHRKERYLLADFVIDLGKADPVFGKSLVDAFEKE